jgi:hypothetical protein
LSLNDVQDVQDEVAGSFACANFDEFLHTSGQLLLVTGLMATLSYLANRGLRFYNVVSFVEIEELICLDHEVRVCSTGI